jgi:hypothetical protein
VGALIVGTHARCLCRGQHGKHAEQRGSSHPGSSVSWHRAERKKEEKKKKKETREFVFYERNKIFGFSNTEDRIIASKTWRFHIIRPHIYSEYAASSTRLFCWALFATHSDRTILAPRELLMCDDWMSACTNPHARLQPWRHRRSTFRHREYRPKCAKCRSTSVR